MEIFYYAVIIDASVEITFCNSINVAKNKSEEIADRMIDLWDNDPFDILIGKAFFSETGELRPGKYIEQISNDKVWKPAERELDPYECVDAWYKR